jgi:acetone carboxylase gamma subunit
MDKDNSNVIDDKEKIKELEKKYAILEIELQRIKEHIKKDTSQVYDKEDNTTIFEQIIIFGLETFFTIFSFIIKP